MMFAAAAMGVDKRTDVRHRMEYDMWKLLTEARDLLIVGYIRDDNLQRGRIHLFIQCSQTAFKVLCVFVVLMTMSDF